MTTTRDGGTRLQIQAKLIELGGDEGQPLAIFQVAPAGQTFTLLPTIDELRELAPLLYRKVVLNISITPSRTDPLKP